MRYKVAGLLLFSGCLF